MSRTHQSKHVPLKEDGDTSLALPLRPRQGNSPLSLSGRKRARSESDDDLSTTDFEDGSELDEALESDWNGSFSNNTKPSGLRLSEDFKEIQRLLVDWVFPNCRRWVDSARYIQPPEYRIPPRKRSRRGNHKARSIFIEVDDPNDPSTILILRVDGYFHLACPFFVSDPSRYETCTLEHDLRSIPDLVKHLRKCHPHILYCPICGQVFDNDLICDRHIRARSCQCRVFDIASGVSPSQLRKIAEKDNRSKHEEERWRRIYAQLFPTAERPQRSAAYLGQGLPLAVSMARDYWELHGRELTEEYLAKENFSSTAQFTGETVSVLCELAGQELVQRVIAGVKNDRSCPRKSGTGEEWELVKAEQN